MSILRSTTILGMVAVVLFTTACHRQRAVPPTSGFTIDVPPNCLTKDIVIEHCDPTSDPPRCKGPTHVNYKSDCEQVQVNAK